MTCLHNHDQILEFLQKIFLKGFQIYQNYLCALIRSSVAYLCPIMNNTMQWISSECRSEEVISFFWRSEYNKECNCRHGSRRGVQGVRAPPPLPLLQPFFLLFTFLFYVCMVNFSVELYVLVVKMWKIVLARYARSQNNKFTFFSLGPSSAPSNFWLILPQTSWVILCSVLNYF